MAAKLVADERSFRKALRFDVTRDVAPADFELLDIEVAQRRNVYAPIRC